LPAACNRNHPLFQHAQLLLQCLKIFTIAGSKLIQLQRHTSKSPVSKCCRIAEQVFRTSSSERPDRRLALFTVGGKLAPPSSRLRTEAREITRCVFCFRA